MILYWHGTVPLEHRYIFLIRFLALISVHANINEMEMAKKNVTYINIIRNGI